MEDGDDFVWKRLAMEALVECKNENLIYLIYQILIADDLQ